MAYARIHMIGTMEISQQIIFAIMRVQCDGGFV